MLIPKKLQKSAFAFAFLAIFPTLSIGPIQSNRACFEDRKSSGKALANFRVLESLGYMLLFPFILLVHPLNFFTTAHAPEQEIVEDEEEEEEDICYIPAIDREEEEV